MKICFFCITFFLCLTIQVQAQISLPIIFSDNMVLQRNTPIPIWGNASKNERVEVRFKDQVKVTRADKTGKWMVKLSSENAGGPFELLVKGKNTIWLKNILVGDVWLCSGQSNMEWPVHLARDAKKEMATASNPFIRHIKVSRQISTLPQYDIKATTWQVCDSLTVGDFTAVGYFFAKKISQELNIPIGLVNASWGGTNIETWISRGAFESSDEFKEMIASMPLVKLDSMIDIKVQAVAKRVEPLQESKLKNINTTFFKETTFDDSRWPELSVPLHWERQELGELDGVVWLRKSIVLTAVNTAKPATLELSRIDDDDITYVNGVKVGSTNQWDAKRKYAIPAGLLVEGKNTIAIRVVDTGGGGGIYGNTNDLRLTIDQTVVELSGKWRYQVESIQSSLNVNAFPSLAYNAMIHPLIPFAFNGVLWYQGESNAPRAYQYRKAFPLLIEDWRKKWNTNFPFYYVQLATFTTAGNSNLGSDWAELREAQTRTLQLPNTGMCVTTDIGNPADIHPTNKQDVGKRLAALALNGVYKHQTVCSGPTFKDMQIKGNEITVSFDNVHGGLTTPDQYEYIKGFEVAGSDQVFYYAKAAIKNNTIVVSSEKVQQPSAVRFGWVGDASDCNLFNAEGFPAVPFRTDQWKTITTDEKYKIEKLK